MNNRLVLYLDILGFKDLTKKKDADELYDIVSSCIQLAESFNNFDDSYSTIYFSDTIILWQNNNDKRDGSLKNLIHYTKIIFMMLLEREIPVRGAISYGEFIVKKDNIGKHDVFFGKALIEAFETEKKENWIGVVCCPSIKQHIRENPNVIISGDVHSADALFKSRLLIQRKDGVILVNPFWELWAMTIYPGYFDDDKDNMESTLKAVNFLRESSKRYLNEHDYTSRESGKYYNTLLFIRNIIGDEWFEKVINQSAELK